MEDSVAVYVQGELFLVFFPWLMVVSSDKSSHLLSSGTQSSYALNGNADRKYELHLHKSCYLIIRIAEAVLSMVHKRSIIIIITISHEYLCVVAMRGARERQDLDKRNHIRFQIKILSTGGNVYSHSSKRLYSVLLGMPFHSTGPAEHYHILCLSRYEMTNLFHVNG